MWTMICAASIPLREVPLDLYCKDQTDPCTISTDGVLPLSKFAVRPIWNDRELPPSTRIRFTEIRVGWKSSQETFGLQSVTCNQSWARGQALLEKGYHPLGQELVISEPSLDVLAPYPVFTDGSVHLPDITLYVPAWLCTSSFPKSLSQPTWDCDNLSMGQREKHVVFLAIQIRVDDHLHNLHKKVLLASTSVHSYIEPSGENTSRVSTPGLSRREYRITVLLIALSSILIYFSVSMCKRYRSAKTIYTYMKRSSSQSSSGDSEHLLRNVLLG